MEPTRSVAIGWIGVDLRHAEFSEARSFGVVVLDLL